MTTEQGWKVCSMTETQVHRFDADTRVQAVADSRWSAEIGPGWNAIGGQPNGGYLLAVALAAASQALPGAEPLTATAHYVKPAVIGPADLDVQVVKRGRLTSTVTATLSQDGSERVRLLAAYSDRTMLGWPTEFSAEPPVIPGPQDCLIPQVPAATGASIADRFEYRVTPATRWARGVPSGTARIEGWLRFSDGREPDLAALALFADAFPPAIFEVIERAVVPTVELTVHLRSQPAPGWVQARFQTRTLLGGILEEDGELWDSQGRLVAMSRQLALVLPMR